MNIWDSLTLAFKGGGGHTKPPLGRSYIGTYGGASFSGEAPFSYEGRVRDAYVNNAIAQRAVRIVAEGEGINKNPRPALEVPIKTLPPLPQQSTHTKAHQLDRFTVHHLPRCARMMVLRVSRSINEPGRALKPWSPVHPRYVFNAQGDLEIGWTRRSRAGLMWPDNIEIPLAEETEQYRVVVGTSVMLEPTQPSAVIPADQVQDYRDSGATTLSLEVRQVGRHTISDPLSFTVSI